MNHSAEIAALKEQLATLTEALAEHVNPPPSQPEPPPSIGYGPKRNGDGTVAYDPEGAAKLRAQEKARREADEAAEREYRLGDLTDEQRAFGYWWDASGLLRNKAGVLVTENGNLVRRPPVAKQQPTQAADTPAAGFPENPLQREARMALENENAARTRGERRPLTWDYDPLGAKI